MSKGGWVFTRKKWKGDTLGINSQFIMYATPLEEENPIYLNVYIIYKQSWLKAHALMQGLQGCSVVVL